jgi:hypothetical protein
LATARQGAPSRPAMKAGASRPEHSANATPAGPPPLRYMWTTQRRASSDPEGSILDADKGARSDAD